MATAKTGRGSNTQVTAGLDPACTHTGFGIGQIGEQALTVFQKGAAFMGQGDTACGA
jgi:hypothetical protein